MRKNKNAKRKSNSIKSINSESPEERLKRIKMMEELGFVDKTKEEEGNFIIKILYK